MKCPVCGYDKPISQWMNVNSEPEKNTVTPRIKYYTLPGQSQYNNLYACPKCGVVRIRKVGDR